VAVQDAAGALRDSRFDERSDKHGELGGGFQLLCRAPCSAAPDKDRGSEWQVGARGTAWLRQRKVHRACAWIPFAAIGRDGTPPVAWLDGDVPVGSNAEHDDAWLGPAGRDGEEQQADHAMHPSHGTHGPGSYL